MWRHACATDALAKAHPFTRQLQTFARLEVHPLHFCECSLCTSGSATVAFSQVLLLRFRKCIGCAHAEPYGTTGQGIVGIRPVDASVCKSGGSIPIIESPTLRHCQALGMDASPKCKGLLSGVA